MLTLIYFMFGPLLLLAVLICADARVGVAGEGGREPLIRKHLRDKDTDTSESGLRYVFAFAAVVTLAGLLYASAGH